MLSEDLEQQIEQASTRLEQGELVAYPTETFYGLAVNPCDKAGMEKLLALKARSLQAGIPLIINCSDCIQEWIGAESGEMRLRRLALQENFWPGPLTLVVSVSERAKLSFHQGVFGPEQSLAFRVSSNIIARSLANTFDSGITATSANPKGEPPASNAMQVKSYFPSMFTIDALAQSDEDDGLFLSGIAANQPSTLVDVRCWPFRIIREGAIPQSLLREWTE